MRKGETARDVEFWKQVNVETERRRRTRTPAYLGADHAVDSTNGSGRDHPVVAAGVRHHAQGRSRWSSRARRGCGGGSGCRDGSAEVAVTDTFWDEWPT